MADQCAHEGNSVGAYTYGNIKLKAGLFLSFRKAWRQLTHSVLKVVDFLFLLKMELN